MFLIHYSFWCTEGCKYYAARDECTSERLTSSLHRQLPFRGLLVRCGFHLQSKFMESWWNGPRKCVETAYSKGILAIHLHLLVLHYLGLFLLTVSAIERSIADILHHLYHFVDILPSGWKTQMDLPQTGSFH